MKTRHVSTLFSCLLAVCLLPAIGFSQQPDVYSDNIVIVVDDSGSMGDAFTAGKVKMDAAKSALKEVLKSVPPSTNIGLVSFHQKWLYPLGPRDNAKLNAAIDKLKPLDNTPLDVYIKVGADCLLEQRAKQHGYGTYRLLVVTDGEYNSAGDRTRGDRFTLETMARGITFDVIGVGMQKDHTLAKKVHSYRRADDPESLKKAISEVMAEVAKPADNSTVPEAFSVIAPLPEGMAQEIIKALSASGNYPIGNKSPVAQQPKASASPPSSPAVASQSTTQNTAKTGSNFLLFLVVGICVLLFIIVIAGMR